LQTFIVDRPIINIYLLMSGRERRPKTEKKLCLLCYDFETDIAATCQRSNCDNPLTCGGVEFYDAKHYLSDCNLWGPGEG
jgi:hypothetical protein